MKKFEKKNKTLLPRELELIKPNLKMKRYTAEKLLNL